MTKSIGWDIGIKNLAYCVLEANVEDTIETTTKNSFTFNNHKYNICKWADISLVTQIESNLAIAGQVSHINNTLKCCATKNPAKQKKQKNQTNKLNQPNQVNQPNQEIENLNPIDEDESRICGKKAFYAKEELNPDGTYIGLCKTHFKKLAIPKLPELSVKKCFANECKSKPVQVLKSHIFKGYCKKHINDMHKANTHTDADFFKINHAKTTAKFDINQLGIALFQELNKIKEDIVEPSIILLENQPVLKNPTMKSMQMFLYSYYLMQIMDKDDLANKKLQCYCASKKLDMIKFLPEDEQTRINTFIETVNNPYQKNKKMSIMMVEVLLKDNTIWSDFFKSHPKQDDLADSLLMTLHYFTKHEISRTTLKEKEKEKGKENYIKKKVKGKAGLKPSKLPIVDENSSLELDELKSKKRNRLINNKKYKKDI